MFYVTGTSVVVVVAAPTVVVVVFCDFEDSATTQERCSVPKPAQADTKQAYVVVQLVVVVALNLSATFQRYTIWSLLRA